jgi:serine/threonine protein kinase
MRTSSYNSPHITSNGRKTISNTNNHYDQPRKPSSWNNIKPSAMKKKYQEDPVYNFEEEPTSDSSSKNSKSARTARTTTSEYSSSFFPDATFGESVFVSHSNRPQEDKVILLERIERILKFAQKRLKKSRVEAFYEKKKRKNGKAADGGILPVQHSDVKLDTILGNGSYNIVYSVKRIKGSILDGSEIVVKTLRSKLMSDLPMLAACAADLRKEGLLLAALQQQPQESTTIQRRGSSKQQQHHTGSNHIVRCLAWSPTGLSAFANGCHDSFFLVLERLDRTLTDTLKEWKRLEDMGNSQRRSSRNFFKRSLKNSRRSLLLSSVKNSFFRSESQSNNNDEFDISINESSTSSSNGSDSDQIQFWKMRLKLMLELCDAVSFLHSQRVIHRDLKPDNVGFDRKGNLKLFDFDVARVLPQQCNWGDNRNECFKLTNKVGSPRYMSPEVARGEHYNETTDVYALGLLAYEILTLKRPFDGVGGSNNRGVKPGNVCKDCVQVVVRGGGGSETNSVQEDRSRGGRQKRRNSFPFRRPNTGDGASSSSGKLSGLFRRRSHSRGGSAKQNRRSPPKYANIRPLLPIATAHEMANHSESSKGGTDTRSKSSKGRSGSHKSTKSHFHSVNDVDQETSSLFWTRSLRTTIDRAWSYDIPTRPLASEFQSLLVEELDRIEFLEEDASSSSYSS